ncbi:MAG: RNA polymerase sigma factor, partial [Gammaproteobacteria bacterium]
RLMEVREPEEIRHPRAFLFRIARNLAANARRVRSPTRAMEHEHELNAIPATYATPEQTYAAAELDRLLKEVIKNLPPRQREVFLLHRYRDKTQTQIAVMIGISLDTVEKHIGAALEACRMKLREAGIDCP